MIRKKYNIIFLIIIGINLYYLEAFANNKDDCKNSSFYIKNIKVDFTKETLVEARSLAENQARKFALDRLLKRLTLSNNIDMSKNTELLSFVDFIKINNEANSDNRYVANFDICFNRELIIKFFLEKKLKYAETYKQTIAVLPIFKGPRGFILWDKKDLWYSLWKENLNSVDGLVNLKIAKSNLYLNRNITSKVILKSDKLQIKKLVDYQNTDSILLVLAEPVLSNIGKTFLNVSVKLFNKNGELDSTIYSNKIMLKKISSIYKIKKNILQNEVINIINSIESSWKKVNLIDTYIDNQIDLWVPIPRSKTTSLSEIFYFNDKEIKVKSTSNFFKSGLLQIGDELVFYNSKNDYLFQNISRGFLNTKIATEHKIDKTIFQKQIDIWPSSINILKSLPFVKETKVISLTSNIGRIVVKFVGNKKSFFEALRQKGLIIEDYNKDQYIIKNLVK